jgi:O-antigen ligase
MSVGVYTTFVAAPPRLLQERPPDPRLLDRAFAVLIIGAIALVVTPDLITYLSVPHEPILPPGEATTSADLPLAQLASLGGSALLLMVTAAVVAMRGHPNRAVGGLLVALLAVNLPYVISPELPPTADYPKILLANLFVLALWNVGAPISGLRWVPYTVAAIAVYSLIVGLIMPDFAMYNVVSEKDIIPGWELAGPFGHANVLGMYCAVAFALTPLITDRRARWAVGGLLFLTLLAAASRTALLAALVVVVWWLVCWVRSGASVRLAGTVLVAFAATTTFVFPFVAWDPDAFTERAHVWAESLEVWHESVLVGMGINWFLDDAQQYANIAKWAYVGTGHNMVVDTLVKSGLLGLAALVPLLVGAVLATRALKITAAQIACFGFLAAFFVAATTEAVWALLPNLQLFPISGMIFAVLILSRRDDPVDQGLP